jgi:hypothetical protein
VRGHYAVTSVHYNYNNNNEQLHFAWLEHSLLGWEVGRAPSRFAMPSGWFTLVALLINFLIFPVLSKVDFIARGECIPNVEDLSSFHCFDRAGRGIKCEDEESECTKWAGQGECSNNPQYMLINCRKSCESCIGLHVGETQVSPDEGTRDKLVERLLETQEYIHEEALYRVATLKKCQNQHKLCTHWAVQGHCEANADFMKEKCAPACQTCRKLF